MNYVSQGFHHKPYELQDFTNSVAPREQPEKPATPKDEVAPQEPVAITFSEDELKAAQKEAIEMGRKKGYAAAKQEAEEAAQAHDVQIMALLEGLMGRIDAQIEEQNQQREGLRRDLANIVIMVSRKLVGNAIDTQPLDSIEPMVNECLTMLVGEPHLNITVSEALQAPLEKYIGRLQRQGQVIEVVTDPQMQVGDCKIEWTGGKAERDQDDLWKSIERIVTRAISLPSNKAT
ncbi:MAG: hypothetical protein MK052_10170 [Alphaproteobacteria bacterium]|nr:hypothetical protein [Alphaproteobacteria bacterium]